MFTVLILYALVLQGGVGGNNWQQQRGIAKENESSATFDTDCRRYL